MSGSALDDRLAPTTLSAGPARIGSTTSLPPSMASTDASNAAVARYGIDGAKLVGALSPFV